MGWQLDSVLEAFSNPYNSMILQFQRYRWPLFCQLRGTAKHTLQSWTQREVDLSMNLHFPECSRRRPNFGKQLETQPTFSEYKLWGHIAENAYPLLHREPHVFLAGCAGHAKCSYFCRKFTHPSCKTKAWHSLLVLKRLGGRWESALSQGRCCLSPFWVSFLHLFSMFKRHNQNLLHPSTIHLPHLISWMPTVDVTSFKSQHNYKLVFYSQ